MKKCPFSFGPHEVMLSSALAYEECSALVYLARDVFVSPTIRLPQIEEYLRQLAARRPELVMLETLGQSWEGRNLTVARVSLSGGKAKNAVLLDAGIHAREWLSPATALYVLHSLANSDDLLQDLDWYILPLLNFNSKPAISV